MKGCIFVGANASGKSTIILTVKLLLDSISSKTFSKKIEVFFCVPKGRLVGIVAVSHLFALTS